MLRVKPHSPSYWPGLHAHDKGSYLVIRWEHGITASPENRKFVFSKKPTRHFLRHFLRHLQRLKSKRGSSKKCPKFCCQYKKIHYFHAREFFRGAWTYFVSHCCCTQSLYAGTGLQREGFRPSLFCPQQKKPTFLHLLILNFLYTQESPFVQGAVDCLNVFAEKLCFVQPWGTTRACFDGHDSFSR